MSERGKFNSGPMESGMFEGIDAKAVRHFVNCLTEYEESVLLDDDIDEITIPDKKKLPAVLSSLTDQFACAAINLCESPIEQMMLAGILWTSAGYNDPISGIWDTTMPFGMPGEELVVSPQHEIANYRADFAIFLNIHGLHEMRLVVECDGHAFHEKTKKQAARDKKRDRDMQIAGWPVLRFSGSEIWNDIGGCGEQVGLFFYNKIDDILKLRGARR